MIIAVVRLTVIFLKEAIREPLTFIWNVIFPTGLYYLFWPTVAWSANSFESYLEAASSMLGYVLFTGPLYGVGLTLLWRRENGFLKCCVQSNRAKIMCLSAQLLAAWLITWVSILLFIIASTITAPDLLVDAILSIMPIAIIFAIISAWACLAVNLLPLSFRDASTTMNIIVLFFMIFATVDIGSTYTALSLLAVINPISALSKPFTLILGETAMIGVAGLVQLSVAFLVGLAAIWWFRINPILRRV